MAVRVLWNGAIYSLVKIAFRHIMHQVFSTLLTNHTIVGQLHNIHINLASNILGSSRPPSTTFKFT